MTSRTLPRTARSCGDSRPRLSSGAKLRGPGPTRLLGIRSIAAIIIACGICSPTLMAQGPAADVLREASAAAAANASSLAVAATAPVLPEPPITGEHRFWDQQNVALFTASAALSAADFSVTRANLQNGGRELNPVVRLFGRSTAGLAANFIGETAGGIGLSYFFHKTGHHKLERMVSLVNIGSSAGAVSYGLANR